YRPRSIIPVTLAAVTATAARTAMVGSEPAFAMPMLAQPGGEAIAAYVVLGAVMGIASALVTRALYRIEDGFDHLPVHWMWGPASQVRGRLTRLPCLGGLRLRDHRGAARPAPAPGRRGRGDPHLVALDADVDHDREDRAPRLPRAHRVHGRLPRSGERARRRL